MDVSRVYIPLESKTLLALDRRTGATLWTAEVASVWPPAVSGDLVFVAAAGEIQALETASGLLRWRAPIMQPAAGVMITAGNLLIVPLTGGLVAAFAAADGRAAWTTELERAAGRLHLAADARAIYLSSSDGQVAALSPADGRAIWRRTLEGTLTPPALARDRLVVGSTTNRVHAFDSRTGDDAWRWDEGADPVGAAADLDLVFLTGLENTVRAVNRGNGHQRWRARVGTRPADPPRAFSRIVVVIGHSPTLSVFEAKTGVATGTYDAPATLQGPPLIDPALQPFSPAIVVIMRDGNVVALTPVAMQLLEPPAVRLVTLPGRPLTREPPPAARPPR